jgi:hypothetical protein
MRLTRRFSQIAKSKARPYEATYVFSEQGLLLEQKLVDLFPTNGSENLTAKF